MKLTDNEKRDAVKYIEEGKPLPEKYRFLLFDESNQVELVWNGKSDEVTKVVLPFQIIERIEEPRTEIKKIQERFDFYSGQKTRDWTNKLIWGDNKFILSSLKNGPMREEIEKNGGIKLIYIDPPFDVGANFSISVEIGDASYEKQPNVLEHIAYRDTWGKGEDSFLSMIYERLILMRDLLADDSALFLHCDWRLNSKIKIVLDEIFGKETFLNEVVWKKISSVKTQSSGFGNVKDSIFLYKKGNFRLLPISRPYDEKYLKTTYRHKDDDGRVYRLSDFTQTGQGEARDFGQHGVLEPPKGKHWIWSQEKINEGIKNNLFVFSKNNIPSVKRYLNEEDGQAVSDIWDDIPPIGSVSAERNGYPTQKPEKLIERIIACSTKVGDVVADFFVGSGTTAAVAEKMDRKWICSDLGKFAIHATRKRLIGVQRGLKKGGQNYRAFEILNLGKYQRQHFIYDGKTERDEVKHKQRLRKEEEFKSLILEAYRASEIQGFNTLHGKKGFEFVSIGPVNQALSRSHVEEVINECLKNKITSVEILAFEFEMGWDRTLQEEAKDKGIRLAYKQIPVDVFDKRAVGKGEVFFHDIAYIEFKTHIRKNLLTVELTDFAVFYNEGSSTVLEDLKESKSKILVENGNLVEKRREKDGKINENVLTKNWHDWIDYWSVDYDYESIPEIINFKKDDGSIEETWTGNYIFENNWQSFRSGSDKRLELVSSEREITNKKIKVAVKVVDIFGNDTMKVMEVKI